MTYLRASRIHGAANGEFLLSAHRIGQSGQKRRNLYVYWSLMMLALIKCVVYCKFSEIHVDTETGPL